MTDDYGVVLASDTVRIERMLPGPIELVWSYLTDSDKRRAWLAGGAMELRVGGRVEHVFRNSQLSGHDDAPPPKYAKHCEEQRMQGRITVCEPPHRLAYTWGANSQVSFELTARADKVHLVVIHRLLPSRDQIVSVAGGWHAHLDILADRLSGRAPAPFWPTHTRLEAEYEQRIPK